MGRFIAAAILALATCLGGCENGLATDMEAAEEPQLRGPVLSRTGTYNGKVYALYRTIDEAKASTGPAAIYSVGTTAMWIGNMASGIASMGYYGTHATLTTTLRAENHLSAMESSVTDEDSPIWPGDHRLSGSPIELLLRGTTACGGVATTTAQASARVAVLVELPSLRLTELGRAAAGGADSGSQPACPPNPCPSTMSGVSGQSGGSAAATASSTLCYDDTDEPSDGAGGGGFCPECLDEPATPTYCRVRYWYWVDTGEVFDYEILWCA